MTTIPWRARALMETPDWILNRFGSTTGPHGPAGARALHPHCGWRA